jgi:hypothetical protein
LKGREFFRDTSRKFFGRQGLYFAAAAFVTRGAIPERVGAFILRRGESAQAEDEDQGVKKSDAHDS